MFKKIKIQSVLDKTGHKNIQQYWIENNDNKPEQISKERYLSLYKLRSMDKTIEILDPVTKY